MGNIMAAALSKLFKENADLVAAAHAAAEVLARGKQSSEQVMDVGDTGTGLRQATFQWRVEFQSLNDLKDFDNAMTAILETVLEA